VAHINYPDGLKERESSERSKRNILSHTLDVFARSARPPAASRVSTAKFFVFI